MDKIISLFNFKNGVGKTTIAHNLAKHLECNIFELEEDYLSLLAKKQNILVNKDTILESGIYDINTKDRNKILHIISNSDYILIPTYNDYKDLIKTAASLRYVKRNAKKTTKVIVIFNRLDFTNKIPETRFTEESKKFLNEVADDITYLYIRNNRAWFQQSHNDMFYLNCSVYNEHTIKNQKSFDKSFIDNFTNNEILEILYQYLFYYGPVYKKLHSLKKEGGDIDHILDEKTITLLRSDFIRVKGTEMASNSDKLYRLIYENNEAKILDKYKHADLSAIENATEEKIEIEKSKKKDAIDKIKRENKILTKRIPLDKNIKTAIKNFRLKEDIIHEGLKNYINLKSLLRHRKVIKDFRNLLIGIDEYSWEEDYD